MAGKLYRMEEVAANNDKTFVSQQYATIASHSVTITLAAVAGEKYYIQQVTLAGTAGGGGAEAIVIKKGTTDAHTDSFTVGTVKSIPFNGYGFVGNEGEAVTIVASATNLTAAKLCVVGFRK